MPSIVIRAPLAPENGEETKCLCEVRVNDLVAVELGPFDDLMQAMHALAYSPYPGQLLDAVFAIVRADDRQLICVAEAAGLLELREMERERRAVH
ncbi:MAG: hypothetical protein EPO29_10285 [Betaproteobacteria bacterium]|nr:MAG: hypothetical protein EPO29_10285 [Betaproteobacteria bacterium]